MSGKRFALLSAGAALLTLAVLLLAVRLLFPRDNQPYIRLPEPLQPGSGAGAVPFVTPPGAPYAPVVITPAKAREMLGNIKRPGGYSMSIQTTLIWNGGLQVLIHHLYAKGPLLRVDTKEKDNATQVHLFTGDAVFRWTDGNLWYYRNPISDLRPEDLVGIPTLDGFLSLSDDQMLSVEYLDTPPRLCLRTSERYYNGEYVISLADGLLRSAIYTENDGEAPKEIFRAILLGFRNETPSADLFLLPDGTEPSSPAAAFSAGG